jgi:hypothetical protein
MIWRAGGLLADYRLEKMSNGIFASAACFIESPQSVGYARVFR